MLDEIYMYIVYYILYYMFVSVCETQISLLF